MGLLLRSATLAGGSQCAGIRLSGPVCADVRVDGDRIAWIDPPGTLSPAPEDAAHDLTGYLLLSAPVEPHAHLDTALLAEQADGDSPGQVLDRARRAARLMLGHGTVAVRTHVTVGGDAGLRRLEALLALRAELADVMTLQLVALPAPGSPGSVLAEALRLGADLVGGAPGLTGDPVRSVRNALDAAAAAGVGVDLHVGDLGTAPAIGELANAVTDGFAQPVALSWCPTVGDDPSESAGGSIELTTGNARLIDAIASAGLAVVVLPRGARGAASNGRGTAPLRRLTEAGITVAGGGGSLRDLADPTGRGDALETASLLVSTGRLRPSEAYTSISAAARSVLGLPAAPAGGALENGVPADLLAIRADTVAEAVAAADPDRTVISGGRLTVRTRAMRGFPLQPGRR
jgi:cytosine/creatinine deaminase